MADKGHSVEVLTIPIRAVAVQTAEGYGVAITHPWTKEGLIFWFRDRDTYTEADLSGE